jgi:hypothetical protein
MVFEGFSGVDFPPVQDAIRGSLAGVVYILCWLRGSVEIPFYVGQTNRFSGRMRDYGIANFKATN